MKISFSWHDLQLCHHFFRLRLFQKFDLFRILVCGGDGSVGWVLLEIDKMDLHRQVVVLLFSGVRLQLAKYREMCTMKPKLIKLF